MEKVDYQRIIAKLIDESNNNYGTSYYCFSGYYPVDGLSRESTISNIKSFINDKLKEKYKGKKEGWFEPLIEEAQTAIAEIDNQQEGVGVFACVHPNEGIKNKKDGGLIAVPLNRKPRPEVLVDKTFSLDQLVWMDATQITALIVEVNHNEVRLYDLIENETKLIWTKENMFIGEKEKENRRSVKYGEETDKLDREEGEENRMFLNYIAEILPKVIKVYSYRYMSVIYSETMSDEIHNFKKKLERNYPNLRQIQLIKSIPQNETEIRDLSIEKIRSGQSDSKINTLKVARENFNMFVTGWKEVCRALRRRRVGKLFLDSTAHRRGYLVNQELIYTFKKPGGKMVDNMAPWIVADVIKTGGEVFIFNENETTGFKEIAALLRY